MSTGRSSAARGLDGLPHPGQRSPVKPLSLADTVLNIRRLLLESRTAGLSNRDVVIFYLEVGQLLSEAGAPWGTGLVEQVVHDVGSVHPELKGISRSNLYHMRQVHRAWAGAAQVVQQLVGQLPWGHHLVIASRVDDLDARSWYLQQSLAQRWGRARLGKEIASGAHKRAPTSSNHLRPQQGQARTPAPNSSATRTPSLSLFRYAGGKSRVRIDLMNRIHRGLSGGAFCEPFCGTAVTSLTLLEHGLVSQVQLNDINKAVAVFWSIVINEPTKLVSKVMSWAPTDPEIRFYFEGVRDGTLEEVELAFGHLVVSNCSFSGMGIRTQKPVSSYRLNWDQWNPFTIARKVDRAHQILRGRVVGGECSNLNAFDVLAQGDHGFAFLDPPHVATGGRYPHSLTQDQHRHLARLLRAEQRPWLLTYDAHPDVRAMYEGCPIEERSVRYSSRLGKAKDEAAPQAKELWICSPSFPEILDHLTAPTK